MRRMVLEDQHQRCSNSSGGGGDRPLKKLKQKKIPQRGLGVAQLEKIRLEEQQKKDTSIAVSLSKNEHHSSSSSIPFPPPFSSDMCSSNSVFRLDPSIPNFDFFAPSPHLPTSAPTTLFDHTSKPVMMVPRHGYIPTMWNSCEFNHGGEGSKLDFGFANHPHLANYSNPISISPAVVQMKQYQQQPSSMVNVSSTSSSSEFNFQMEPPSNQSNSSNYTTPLWHGEEKLAHIIFASFCREGLASSTPLHVERRGGTSKLNPENGPKGNGALDGDFLTLGLPESTCSSSTSRSDQNSAIPAVHYGDLPIFDLVPFQGSIEDPALQTGPVRSALQQPFYSFLPPKGQIGQETTNLNNIDRRDEAEGSVDANLKL
ncbi:hypothetical protein HHK36_003558 [Tetracentron sinense]|uniref:Uncharacterized protein n=1 Tax=Tetracentron sinense TaxID=13715 RepID=A0A835DSA1_TETSI|nr:hypothetical protein HHK36_003558 [Tetracentron sinense]